MFEHDVFWEEMYCIEQSTCDIDFSAPGAMCPLAPLGMPMVLSKPEKL